MCMRMYKICVGILDLCQIQGDAIRAFLAAFQAQFPPIPSDTAASPVNTTPEAEEQSEGKENDSSASGGDEGSGSSGSAMEE